MFTLADIIPQASVALHAHAPRPWQELAAVSNPQETQPLWYRYPRIFLWPQPLPEDVAGIRKIYF